MANDDSRRLQELTIGEAKRVVVYGVALVLQLRQRELHDADTIKVRRVQGDE